MSCYIFGAGDFYGLAAVPGPGDRIIAADGGWNTCRSLGLVPDLLIGDFDSLKDVPEFDHIRRVPVEKDDTDMMLAIKEGLAEGETVFHLYGGMGGRRTDHTIANLQALLYLAVHGAQGYLYGDRECYTTVRNGCISCPAREEGILSVFCMGEDAQGVSICGAQYQVDRITLSAEFPLGVSNHFVGRPVTISVEKGTLLIGIHE